jgi:peptidoglycan/xylan/chitin deacetylase (PgdA/CDA1 family)
VAVALLGSGSLGTLGPVRPATPVPVAALARPALARAPGRPKAIAPLPQREIDCQVRKCIALTFDDGPVPGTARLLDVLKAEDVRVTFFVLGSQVAHHPDLIRREIAEGHEVGNHTYRHVDLARASNAKIKAELGHTQSAIRHATGITPVLLRPPYGATNRRVSVIAQRYRLAQCLWTLDPLDWRNRDPALVTRRVVRGARPGYIILLHDIHPTTVAAVPGIVQTLTRNGFVFVTISELTGGRPLKPGKAYRRVRVSPRPATAATAGPGISGIVQGLPRWWPSVVPLTMER